MDAGSFRGAFTFGGDGDLDQDLQILANCTNSHNTMAIVITCPYGGQRMIAFVKVHGHRRQTHVDASTGWRLGLVFWSRISPVVFVPLRVMQIVGSKHLADLDCAVLLQWLSTPRPGSSA